MRHLRVCQCGVVEHCVWGSVADPDQNPDPDPDVGLWFGFMISLKYAAELNSWFNMNSVRYGTGVRL